MAPLAQLDGAPAREWQHNGLCRVTDSTVFFAPARFEHKPDRLAREAKAKAICARCPVREPCLRWALAVREPHGVWGGYSESERKQLLGGRRAAS